MTFPCNTKHVPLQPEIKYMLWKLSTYALSSSCSSSRSSTSSWVSVMMRLTFYNLLSEPKQHLSRPILFIAGIGVFIGAALSNGMMDIARHGIYQPEHFYFAEIMCILLAVMLTDVVLLDVFNTMGMPTSTTVSMVFELLGGTFALALIKVHGSDTLGPGRSHQHRQGIVRHHGDIRIRSHRLLLRYAGAMAGTCRLHFQLHQEDEVQHRYLRRYRSYLHHLFHADKRFEGQLIHDSRKTSTGYRRTLLCSSAASSCSSPY